MHPTESSSRNGSLSRYVTEFRFLLEGLNKGFPARYNAEDYCWITPIRPLKKPVKCDFFAWEGIPDLFHLVIPMVSFTTTGPKEASDHANEYGRYCVTLTEKWGQQVGMRQLQYVNEKTPHQFDTAATYRKMQQGKFPIPGLQPWPEILFFKPKIGSFKGDIHSGRKYTNVGPFIQEAEWRYIADADYPKIYQTQICPTQAELNENSNQLAHVSRLQLDHNEIIQVVVTSPEELDQLLKTFPHLDGRVITWRDLG